MNEAGERERERERQRQRQIDRETEREREFCERISQGVLLKAIFPLYLTAN